MSPRLERLVQLVPAGALVADVGTDHALLPAALVQRGRVPRAIASDLRPQPLAGARAKLSSVGLISHVELRLGDGFDVLDDDEVGCIVVAGMGGTRIAAMLRHRLPTGLQQLVIQANDERQRVRRTLADLGWRICEEHADLSEGRWFVSMLAAPDPHAAIEARDFDELDWFFGARLREAGGVGYEALLALEADRVGKILASMPAALREAPEQPLRAWHESLRTELSAQVDRRDR